MHIKDFYLFIVKLNISQHSTIVVCAIAEFNYTRIIQELYIIYKLSNILTNF